MEEIFIRPNGSHGCINLPTKAAKIMFENIEPGVAVGSYMNYQAQTKNEISTVYRWIFLIIIYRYRQYSG